MNGFWLALLLLGSAAAQEAAATASGPRIRVEPQSFDFGAALQARTLRKEFTLHNSGDAELTIEGVSTTCGCTAALVGQQRLAPGASTTLRVTLETRSHQGKLERQVLVRSNDATTPLLTVKVQATVSR